MKMQLLSLMLLLPMVVNADQLTEGMPTFNYCVAMPEIQKTDGMLDSDGANTWWGYVKTTPSVMVWEQEQLGR